jgi:hypothetical protein
MASLSIPQPTRFLLFLQRPSEQIFEKDGAQCLDRSLLEAAARKRESIER